MHRPSLIEPIATPRVAPNMADWAATCARFDWAGVRSELYGAPGASGNIAAAIFARHARGPGAQRIALRCLRTDGPPRELSYGALAARAERFAGVLAGLSLQPGDRVFVLCSRRAELFEVVLGALLARCVVAALFAAFGPEPLRTRLSLGKAQLLVTTPALYARKIAPIRESLPALREVLLLDAAEGDGAGTGPGAGGAALPPGTRGYEALMRAAAPPPAAVPTAGEDPALLHFTSGTTGTPKGALHVHDAALMHFMTGRYALDLHPDDVFWCTADPGWVTGMSYGVIAPLLHGVTIVLDEAEFDAQRWYRILEEQAVSVWYTAPTAIRLLMGAGAALAAQRRRPALRLVASVGEPLNAEAVWWGVDTLGLPIHDNWWQTETGGIMIANTPGQAIKPGSMGRPLPGVEAAVVERAADGSLRVLDAPDATGELALRRGWPSMFRAYLEQPERYAKCFADGWYLSGDLVRRDADGYFWFTGRSDDVIKTSGHLVGPFEVESVLMHHPAVIEAAVIGKPDPAAGEIIKAFVTLRGGAEAGEPLREQLLAHARRRLGPALAPREIAFATALPHTRSGKIMRRLLRARELGLPEGDTSALESDAS